MYSLNHFREKINDIARPYHFLVSFQGGCFGPLTDRQKVTASLRSSTLPNIDLQPISISYFGIEYKLAGTPTYSDMPASFIIDSEYTVLREWTNVLNQVYQYQEGVGPVWNSPTVYMGTVILDQLNTSRQMISQYKLSLAYLTGIAQVAYSQESKEVLTFDATIRYSYYTKTK
jgi:hypothetical protein